MCMKTRRWAPPALAIGMMLSLAACGNKEETLPETVIMREAAYNI